MSHGGGERWRFGVVKTNIVPSNIIVCLLNCLTDGFTGRGKWLRVMQKL